MSSNYDLRIRNQIVEMTTTKLLPVIDNVYKESLRSMLNIFGNMYYIDGNGNRIKVNCSHGNPERIAGRLKSDNTLVLPMITVVETQTASDMERMRYQHVISEKKWDSEKLKATRVLSLPPRPVNITYEVNIWAKYKADMDMLRSSIFSLFSPDINIETQYSVHNKAFINGERDLGNVRPAKPKSKRGPVTFFVDIEAPNGRSVRRSLVRGVDDLDDGYEQPPAAISLETLLLSLSLSSTFYWDTPVAFDPVTADFFLQQFEVGVGGNIDVPGLDLSVDMETTAEASISRAPIIVDLTLPQFTTNKTITFEPIDIGLSLPTLETKVETSLDIITVDLTVPALNIDNATNFEPLSLSMSLPDAEIASDI
ncbi:MAG: hypothetical protein VW270_09840, partial [Candidatus Poseidoniales archaeon]